jgi:hypothetical protein
MSVTYKMSAVEASEKSHRIPDSALAPKKANSITTLTLYDKKVARHDSDGVVEPYNNVVAA